MESVKTLKTQTESEFLSNPYGFLLSLHSSLQVERYG